MALHGRVSRSLPRSLSRSILVLFLLGAFVLAGGTAHAADPEQARDLFYGAKRLPDTAYVLNGTPYVPLSVVETYGDLSKVEVDAAGKRLVIDLSRIALQMADDATTTFVRTFGGTVHIPFRTIDGVLYCPMDTMGSFVKLAASASADSVRLHPFTGTETLARITGSDTVLVPALSDSRRGQKINLAKGETVTLLGETGTYYKIAAGDGTEGYVLKPSVAIIDVDLAKLEFFAPRKEKRLPSKGERINLVWQYVGQITPAGPDRPIPGIDVLAPTWFDLIVDGDGSVENNGDLGYTANAHRQGYQVWATITNNMSTKGSTAFTSKVLANSALLNRSVAQYLFYASLYDADGINIDYETVADSDRDGLAAFTALLRSYTERQGLVLSIDTLIPKPWTIEYDRAALSRHVDFLAIMTYDEHYSSSPAPGSVASLPWVEEAVAESLKSVPKEKLLLGIPMYTRVWVVDANGKLVRNASASMPYIEALIAEKALVPQWLDREKQYFISYPNDIYTDKVWIEDRRSVAHRLELVQRYGLAGSACWQYSQASPAIWEVFEGMLRQDRPLSDYE